MAAQRCPRCHLVTIKAHDEQGNELELVRHFPNTHGALFGVKNDPVDLPTGRQHTNLAFAIAAYVLHACELESFDAPVKVQEFPSLGDPVPS